MAEWFKHLTAESKAGVQSLLYAFSFSSATF
jgi:hypothetical protein